MYDGISCTAEHSFREIVPEKNLDAVLLIEK